MKPRLNALTVPETDRYWVVELEEKGQHHFQFPGFPKAGQAIECAMAYSDRAQGSGVQTANVLAGLVTGYCWYHRGMVLETEAPNLGASHDTLLAYSEKVSAELQDAGYSSTDLLAFYNQATPILLEWWSDLHGITATGVDEDDDAEPPEPEETEWTTEDGANPGPFEDTPDSSTDQSSAAA